VAQQVGATHTEVAIRPEDVADELEHVLASLDQPSNDGINTYFVSRVARQAGLTVALSGIGGDELFGGYPTFTRLPRLVRAVRTLAHIPGAVAAAGSALERGPILSPRVRLGGWVSRGDHVISSTYFGLRGMFSWPALQQLVAPEVLHEAKPALRQLECATLSTAGGVDDRLWDLTSRLELTSYMRHQLLRDTDVMSMAHSLEVRVPFVDPRVVETVLGLPSAVRRLGRPKQLLRDAVPRLPACVRDRRDKQGFIFPFQEWMAGPLREPVRDLVQAVTVNLSGVLVPTGVERLMHAFERGEAHWSRVWALAALGTLRA
jgi:asparagine synthase (glutamine-hydrolysing)